MNENTILALEVITKIATNTILNPLGIVLMIVFGLTIILMTSKKA